MSRGSFSGGKGCLKHHKIVYFFATWSESFLDIRQNFFDTNVKTAFYVSIQTYCRKKFIHQFQNMREIFSDFGQETRHTRFFPKLHSACGERVWQKFPWNFFQFSAGFPNWTLALRRNFSSKKTFHEKNIYFYRFRTLTELHLRVQMKVLFRNTVSDFFHRGMNLSQKFLNLVDFLWIFHSKLPSTSPSELLYLLKECFFLENPDICLSFSNFEKTFN